MTKRKTWILVADGGRASMFERLQGGALRPIPSLSFDGPHGHARDYGTDAPGRSFARAGASERHAIEPRMPLDRAAEQAFVRRTVEAVEAAHDSGQFDRLVIVAAPTALGDIRECLGRSLAAAVIATSAADLTKSPIDDIAEHVARLDLTSRI